MAEALSADNLMKCLFQKDKYKATQAYLHQVTLFNQPVYQMFNQALSNVLLKPNRNYMSKLMALRLFKELIVTANFTLIDALDEKIQDLILATAQYNKKSKEINRGANYFIDVDKQKKEGEILKIGATFVLLASEILVVLAKWYPVDQDGQETRFAQYFKELQNGGVTLPQQGQLNFFKKEEQQKFRKNYNSWLKWYVHKVKEQEVQQTTRQIKEENTAEKLPKSKNTQMKNQVQNNQPVVANNSTLNVATSVINQAPQAPKEQKKLQKVDEPEKPKPKIESKPLQSAKNNDKQQQQYQKLKQQMIRKYEKELNDLRAQSHRMKKQVDQATNLMSKVHQEKVKLQEEIYTKNKEISQLASQKTELQSKISTLNKPEVKEKELSSECFQIKIIPPKVYEQLQEQNDVLQTALQAAENLFQTKKQQLQQELSLVRQQNSKLSKVLVQKEQEIKKYKEEVNVEKQMIQNIIKQDSLIITEEIKYVPLQNKRQFSEPKPKEDIFSKTCTMSEYLKTNQKEFRQNVQPRNQSRNKSLRKTESSHKMSTINSCQPFYNTAMNGTKTGFPNQKLTKTTNNFYSKKAFQRNSSNLITILPFLQSYFPVLPIQSKQFKASCLTVTNKQVLCYQNELIRVALKKINWSKYILTVSNKLSQQLKVKIASESKCFSVEGDKHKKLKPCSSEQMELNNTEFDINLRYVALSFVTGNQKLSLTSPSSNERSFSVPLPITILDFCKINTQNMDCFSNKVTSKFCSNKLPLSSCQPNLVELLTEFKVSYNAGGLSAKAVAEFRSETKSKVLIEVMQTQYQVCVSVQFLSDQLQSCNLSKVLMQVILFQIQN